MSYKLEISPNLPHLQKNEVTLGQVYQTRVMKIQQVSRISIPVRYSHLDHLDPLAHLAELVDALVLGS